MILHKRNFYTSTIYSKQRIGPHNKNVISMLVVCLLNDSHAEKRNNATRFIIYASSKNVKYINYLHKFFVRNGYCNPENLKLNKQIGKNNKIYFNVKFKTFSFSSLNFLHNAFYNEKKEKIVPLNIDELLDPQAFTF